MLDTLRKTYDVAVLGINYHGDPHDYPYKIWPCWPGGDGFGVKRVVWLLDQVQPDVVVLQNDPWNVPAYVDIIREVPVYANLPLVGFIAVDGKNCKGEMLNGLQHAIFWTEFAQHEAMRGGMTVPSSVVPLGIDLETYRPMNRRAARLRMGIPPELSEAFIVGNVNRNQPRKRLDLTLQYFADWIHYCGVENAYLFVHVAPTGDNGIDVRQLAEHYNIINKTLIVEPPLMIGASEDQMVDTYNSFDVQVSTTQGEGWGLTTMEGMACGIPQVIPDWSALGEWARDAAFMMKCSQTAATMDKGINSIGGVPDSDDFIRALAHLYYSEPLRERYSQQGLALVNQPQYRWSAISDAFAKSLEEVFACV